MRYDHVILVVDELNRKVVACMKPELMTRTDKAGLIDALVQLNEKLKDK